MNKGMFYCLPFLALTQVAASNALPRVEVTTLFKVAEVAEASDSTTVKAPKLTVANPISGRNANVSPLVKIFKPRAGRNASLLKGRNVKMIKRR